jgi:hypothetical protein
LDVSIWLSAFEQFLSSALQDGVGLAIGGYQEGGNTSTVSYSAYLGSGIHRLYEQAVSDGTRSDG